MFILVGYMLKRMRIINENVEKKISFLSFNLLLPLVVALNIIFSDFSIIDIHFLSTFFTSGIVILISSLLIGKYTFGLNGKDASVFGFSACYGNLVSIRVPIIFAVIALPSMITSIDITITDIRISYSLKKIYILTIIKNIIFPLITFINAKYIFNLNQNLIFMATFAAALPSGIQTYYMSYRYSSLKTIIPTNVVLSTLFSVLSLSVVLMLFGY